VGNDIYELVIAKEDELFQYYTKKKVASFIMVQRKLVPQVKIQIGPHAIVSSVQIHHPTLKT
jgi:hypothetical protein